MDNYDSSAPLLLQDDITAFTIPEPKCDQEDYSSGYDSTDISDTESVSSTGSRDTFSRHVTVQTRREEEVMNFRSTTNLCSSLKLILEMPDLCDVTFLVGPSEVPVHGVRAILGTRSCIFYQLLLKHLSLKKSDLSKQKNKKTTEKQTSGISRSFTDKLLIPVKKYDPEVFRILVEFVHCGSANIAEDTVAGLYCAARHFRLDDLSPACLDFVERCLVGGRAASLLMSARKYSQHKASQMLFDKIYAVLDKRYSV